MNFNYRSGQQLDKEHSSGTITTTATSRTSCDRSFTGMSINSHSYNAKAVHSLEAELIRLRESTKDALQQSWDEVETLQQQCAAHLDITAQLENEIVEARRKEEYWHKRCLEAEFQLLQTDENHCDGDCKANAQKKIVSARRQARSLVNPMLFMSWPMIRKEISSKSLDTKSVDSETQSLSKVNEKINDLEAKLDDREGAIMSLESTVERHVKAMHSMQAEMQCMMETQRIKEKKIQSNFRRKEKFLDRRITLLENENEKKDAAIKSQKRKSYEYKKYIEELASELERVLGVVQKAEKNGIDFNQLDKTGKTDVSSDLNNSLKRNEPNRKQREEQKGIDVTLQQSERKSIISDLNHDLKNNKPNRKQREEQNGIDITLQQSERNNMGSDLNHYLKDLKRNEPYRKQRDDIDVTLQQSERNNMSSDLNHDLTRNRSTVKRREEEKGVGLNNLQKSERNNMSSDLNHGLKRSIVNRNQRDEQNVKDATLQNSQQFERNSMSSDLNRDLKDLKRNRSKVKRRDEKNSVGHNQLQNAQINGKSSGFNKDLK